MGLLVISLPMGETAAKSEAACGEKQRLRQEVNLAAADYNRALEELHDRAGIVSKAEYETLNRLAEQAREKWETLWEALDRHVAEHRCR